MVGADPARGATRCLCRSGGCQRLLHPCGEHVGHLSAPGLLRSWVFVLHHEHLDLGKKRGPGRELEAPHLPIVEVLCSDFLAGLDPESRRRGC